MRRASAPGPGRAEPPHPSSRAAQAPRLALAVGALLTLAGACAEDPAEARRTPAPLRVERGPLALEVTRLAWDETDAAPLGALRRGTPEGVETLMEDLRAAALIEGRGGTFAYVVDEAGALWRVGEARRARLLDGVLAAPVPAPGGLLVTRRAEEPGRSAVWQLPEGAAARLLVADAERPCPLPDGRLAFVSTRTSVASVWLLEATGPVQLTNVGLAAGRPLTGFVPPPAAWLGCDAEALAWDAGDGATWRLELATGRVQESLR